jgi:hypothetical protein
VHLPRIDPPRSRGRTDRRGRPGRRAVSFSEQFGSEGWMDIHHISAVSLESAPGQCRSAVRRRAGHDGKNCGAQAAGVATRRIASESRPCAGVRREQGEFMFGGDRQAERWARIRRDRGKAAHRIACCSHGNALDHQAEASGNHDRTRRVCAKGSRPVAPI